MSITGLTPAPDKNFNKTSRHRNGSDELDVFEASRYFAGEPPTQKIMIKEKEIDNEKQSSSDYWNRVSPASATGGGGGVRRISLDIPSMRNNHNHHHQNHHSLFSSFQSHHHTAADLNPMPKDKTHKQPSSPGGRLASFLNSLFSQSSKKKKPKSTAASTHDPDLSDGSGGGRRKRRSSISHFTTTYTTNPNQNAAVYSVSSKNSGFAQTPIKLPHRSFSDHKKNPDQDKPRSRDEKKPTINRYNNTNRIDKPIFDDGAESDSSSDLFELQNFGLGDYSSGLPVYETTHMDSIKRGAPISVHGP